ncbi:MAG TPA: hypothetical protein VFU55_03285 [Terracidiphilus sp.]|nr:hypothetical protein [Terracidiphilus sp.]
MNTRKSIVAETLQNLSQKAKLWHDRIDLIEAGQPLNRAELVADFGGLMDLCQNLRDAILSEDSSAQWTTKDQLNALVVRLDGVAAARARYLDLAHALSSGTVVHHRERTRTERLQLRDAAVAELMEISAQAMPPELPGPGAEAWLHWACDLEDETNDPSLVQLQRYFPRVDDFVRQLDIKTWQVGVPAMTQPAAAATAAPAATPAPAFAPAPAPAVQAEKSSGRGGKQAREEKTVEMPAAPVFAMPAADFRAEAPTASVVEEIRAEAAPAMPATMDVSNFDWTPKGTPMPEPAAVGSVTTSMEAEASPSSVAVAAEAEEETPVLHRVKAKGGVSFFPDEELECFSLYLEKAKRESKDDRKVRALFAISHWLNPIDQNPVVHPKCGIRSQVDYAGATDLMPSSPAEASKAIQTHNNLLLFTGGADLLRWSLSQPPNGHFDALASVRRLSLEHIRMWFHDLYKIELAEPQLADIHRLTSGIPLLVGEMHRLIVHDADAPPAWLGFELWTTVLTNFGNRLPAIAHELSAGSSSIRLTAREIEILKMMVIVSDDFATPETVIAGMTTDWSDYRHAEFLALGQQDAESVGLLQRLGMLPTRDGSSSTPIQALVPLEHGDALRQVVRYL